MLVVVELPVIIAPDRSAAAIMSAKSAEPTPIENKFVLNPEEAAEFRGVSLRTIRYWVATRRTPLLQPGRFVRFKRADLTSFLVFGCVDPSRANSRFP
jgi:excisionase family DNA binding protein